MNESYRFNQQYFDTTYDAACKHGECYGQTCKGVAKEEVVKML